MVKDFVPLANIVDKNHYCSNKRYILCQKDKACKLTSAALGRKKYVFRRLHSTRLYFTC